MKTTNEPNCPACGGPPASLIEDGYGIDLVPWWRYYAQKLNPFRLIRWVWRKLKPAECGWVRMGVCDEQIWECERVTLLFSFHGREVQIQSLRTIFLTPKMLKDATHWFPLPPLP